MIISVKVVMTLATLCYALGWSQRIRNNGVHRKMMILGFLLTLGIAVVLVVGVNVFGATYSPAGWLISAAGGEAGAHVVLVAHRVFATLALVTLVTQVVAGIRRLPLHKRLPPVVIAMWLITYLSGMVIFT